MLAKYLCCYTAQLWGLWYILVSVMLKKYRFYTILCKTKNLKYTFETNVRICITLADRKVFVPRLQLRSYTFRRYGDESVWDFYTKNGAKSNFKHYFFSKSVSWPTNKSFSENFDDLTPIIYIFIYQGRY